MSRHHYLKLLAEGKLTQSQYDTILDIIEADEAEIEALRVRIAELESPSAAARALGSITTDKSRAASRANLAAANAALKAKRSQPK